MSSGAKIDYADGQKGLTLLELLAALTISSMAILIGAQIFGWNQNQFYFRMRESEFLQRQYLLQETVRGQLKHEIVSCKSDHLVVWNKKEEWEVVTALRKRFPGLETLTFNCIEVDEHGALILWNSGIQPKLVEYEWIFTHKGLRQSHRGSWLL